MSRNRPFGIQSLRRALSGVVWLAAALVLATGCNRAEKERPLQESTEQPAATSQRPVIYTTFYPTMFFAQRIGGEHVEVVCPCPADADPAFWMPDDGTIAAYQRADLIVLNGAAFEKWVARVTLPMSRMVDTAAPLADGFIVLEETITHSHGPIGGHSHEGIDGHTWLDPLNARTQAGEIASALLARFPAHKDAFEQGYAALAQDLDALDARLKALADRINEQVLLCSHPAYNYLCRRYGWRLRSYQLDPQEMPDDAKLNEIKAHLAEQPARIMLWESQPAAAVAAGMAGLGLTNIVFSPCETLDSEQLERGADFLAVMNDNVGRLQKALLSSRP